MIYCRETIRSRSNVTPLGWLSPWISRVASRRIC